jgi:hypothetical protein
VGLAALVALYFASGALLAWLVRPGARRASPLATLFLVLLPLCYTAEGFLPERTLSPTPMLVGVAPWADPELVARATQDASAPNPVLLDPASQMLPWSRAARDDLLFNPAQGSGAALLGNGQSAVLFPTEAASRLLAPFRAVTYSQAARLLLAAWGMFLLLRLAGSGELAACAGVAVYLGSGFVQLWRLHPHSLVAAAAPWILAAAFALWRTPGPRSATSLAAAGALGVAGGHPETLLHVVLFAALTVPALAWAKRSERAAEWNLRLAWGAASALLAFLLAAPVLLPFIDNLRVSVEWVDRRPLGRTGVEVSLRDAIERLRPAGALHAHGDPVAATWRGPENLAELGGAATGGAALFLALLGVATSFSRPRRPALWWIAAVGLVGLLVGAHTPLVSAPFGMVPLLEDTLLKRLGLWWVLSISILVAAAVDAAGVASSRARHLVVAAALAALAVVLAMAGSPRAEIARMAGLEVAPMVLAVVAVTSIAAWARSGRPASRVAGAALLLCALVPARPWVFASWIPSTSPAGFYAGTPSLHVAVQRSSDAPRAGFRVTGIEAALPPHSAAFYGLEEIRAYDPMTLATYHRFFDAVFEPGRGWSRVLDHRAPALSMLGVRFLFEQPPPLLPDDAGVAGAVRVERQRRRNLIYRSGWLLAYEGPDGVLWERPEALPRAFFPLAWRVAPADRALALTAAIDDFAVLAIVDHAPDSAAPVVGATPTNASAPTNDRPNPEARVLALEVGRGIIATEVDAHATALLATSQPSIPGWRLTIDGTAAPARLRLVNTAFLGVAVPAGRHRVELRYAPTSWRLGLVLGATGVAIGAVLLYLDRRARPAC